MALCTWWLIFLPNFLFVFQQFFCCADLFEFILIMVLEASQMCGLMLLIKFEKAIISSSIYSFLFFVLFLGLPLHTYWYVDSYLTALWGSAYFPSKSFSLFFRLDNLKWSVFSHSFFLLTSLICYLLSQGFSFQLLYSLKSEYYNFHFVIENLYSLIHCCHTFL